MRGIEERLRAEADRAGIDQIVVGAVVHRGAEILVLRRGDDDFLPGIEELPSGGVEPGESLMTALARELAEEIGWSGPVDVDPGFVTSFDYVSKSGRKARQYTFALAADDGPIVLSSEHTAYRWLDPQALDDSDLTPESKRTIRDWLAR